MIKTNFSTLLLCLFLSACGMKKYAPDPVTSEQFIKNNKQEIISTLALDPQKRLFITNLNNGRYCSEFPTDVGLDTNITGKLALSLQKTGADDGDLQDDKQILDQYYPLDRRSQSLQLFLASSYYYCQLFMNGNLDEKSLITTQLYLFEKTVQLMAYEFQFFHDNAPTNPQLPDNLKPSSNADDVIDSLKSDNKNSTNNSIPENK